MELKIEVSYDKYEYKYLRNSIKESTQFFVLKLQYSEKNTNTLSKLKYEQNFL